MSTKRPPRLATLLITRLADNEPLAGDLLEEYQAGRSDAWYWRQTIAAVFAELRTLDIRELFAAKSPLMQCVMIALTAVCAVFSVKLIGVVILDEAMFQAAVGQYGMRELSRIALSFAIAVPVGVMIAKLHEHSRGSAVLAFATTVPVWAFANVYLLDGMGSLDAMLPHAVALLVFIAGLLTGGIHMRLPVARTPLERSSA